jgi:hypothetical protein
MKKFQEFKEALIEASALFYPDYSLMWILRVDASDEAVGYCLMMDPTRKVLDEEGNYVAPPEQDPSRKSSRAKDEPPFQPIAFGSKKFSRQAKAWDAFNKEGYSMYYGVKDNEYLLRGKHFLLQGDHRNLQWMEAEFLV